jgi:sugar O-acyltransferase (sialic acid O-acetyltransferase NeuD family)
MDDGRSLGERTEVVIVGAGGFGREVLQYVRDTFATQPSVRFAGFLDDRPPDLGAFDLAGSILGDTHRVAPAPHERYVIAVGHPPLRTALAARLAARGARFLTVVHPLAFVASSAKIGEGCILAPFASVGAHAVVGDHTVLTFYASVGHDARVGRCCALSPHAVANGGSVLGDEVFLGAHAVVNPLQRVGDGAKVAAGAVVYRPVPAGTLAAGNPAKARPSW